MRDRLLKAVTEYLKGGIAKHKANIEVYLNQTVGIGEHSDIVETIELELEQVANYHDKLEMLTKYFIQPQLQQAEGDTTDEQTGTE